MGNLSKQILLKVSLKFQALLQLLHEEQGLLSVLHGLNDFFLGEKQFQVFTSHLVSMASLNMALQRD
jgi:hypothetical protein